MSAATDLKIRSATGKWALSPRHVLRLTNLKISAAGAWWPLSLPYALRSTNLCGCLVATKSAIPFDSQANLGLDWDQPQESFCGCLVATKSAVLRLTPKPASNSATTSLKIPSATA